MSRSTIKILFLVDTYETPLAGTEGQLYMLIAGLDRSIYEPHLTLLRRSKYIEKEGFPCPVDVLGLGRMAAASSLLKMLSFAKEVKEKEVAVVHMFFNDVSVIAPLALKLYGLKTIISRRDMGYWYTPSLLFALRFNSFFIDHAVANSEAVRNAMSTKEWIPKKKTSVIYNGYESKVSDDLNADTNEELKGVVSGGGLILGVVANVRPLKRIDDVIRAMPIILQKIPSARFLHVGGGDVAALKKLAEKIGVLEAVCFAGKQCNPEEFIQRFDVAILCSESEGFSNSIIEYMRCGKPVICTDVGGNGEIVTHGETGYMIDVGDVKSLAAYVIFLFQNKTIANSIGEAGCVHVLSSYTRSEMLRQYSDLYQRLSGATENEV